MDNSEKDSNFFDSVGVDAFHKSRDVQFHAANGLEKDLNDETLTDKLEKLARLYITDAVNNMDDFKISQVNDALNSWYNITQSMAKILLKELDNLDEKNARTAKTDIKKFGWVVYDTSCLRESDLIDGSPYHTIRNYWDIENTAISKKRKRFAAEWDQINKDVKAQIAEKCPVTQEEREHYARLKADEFFLLAQVMDEIRRFENPWFDEKKEYLDENSGVSALYAESKELEAQALRDIDAVGGLAKRFDELHTKLDSSKVLGQERYRRWIDEEIIYKAIAIGYTAGINANTTKMLRNNQQRNASNNT